MLTDNQRGFTTAPFVDRTHQDKDWLDFQWCQTGHNGEHVPERGRHVAQSP